MFVWISFHSEYFKSVIVLAGVTRIFFGSNFVTVTKAEESTWDILKPEVFAAIMDFYTSKQPLFYDSVTSSPSDTAIKEVCDVNQCYFYDLMK